MLIGLGLGMGGPRASADVRLPALIGDNMVLEQGTEVGVWGWARPGEIVKVTADWAGATGAEAKGDDRGNWRTMLRTPKAGGPYSITIAGDNTITLKNVLVGEVWVCSGQSNMEFGLQQASTAAKDWPAAKHTDLRLFMVRNTTAVRPMSDCVTEGGGWRECTPATAGIFSAVGYYFAREIQAAINVPVGLISADWGGTPAEAWTSERGLRNFPGFKARLDSLAAMSADPNERLAKVAALRQAWWDAIDSHKSAPGPTWAQPAFDDKAWKSLDLPATLGPGGLDQFDGVVYFRKSIELPGGFAGNDATLQLGPIDDMDDAWINGISVGVTHDDGQWATPRHYAVPVGVLHAGINVIAVRVYDQSGPGGINGKPEQMKLASTDTRMPAVSLAGSWKYVIGPSKAALPALPMGGSIDANTPTALYNGMIAPLLPYTIKGAIWYQGESNRGEAMLYRSLFPALIKNWREDWKLGDFPFYFVQIAPFTYGGDRGETAELREAQMMTLSLPHTGMAVTMDVGDPKDIHPTEKKEVGRRLALWALAKDYGKSELVYSGPLFKSAATEGGSMRVKFEHAAGGLVVKGSALTQVMIAGEDRKFVPAVAVVDGETLVVSSKEVARPVAVRYGWSDDGAPNLFNQAGLPASPFRTDDWARK